MVRDCFPGIWSLEEKLLPSSQSRELCPEVSGSHALESAMHNDKADQTDHEPLVFGGTRVVELLHMVGSRSRDERGLQPPLPGSSVPHFWPGMGMEDRLVLISEDQRQRCYQKCYRSLIAERITCCRLHGACSALRHEAHRKRGSASPGSVYLVLTTLSNFANAELMTM